ncbi:Tyrocidine synthase 3 [Eumeta japonica]|uniref:Tyrocidine synthase 3 n=1 Tax=Eumeta variegata TaxID=151549 RepID=A0A4C1XDH2_EUMVA|nr:Tyrocidine synthase 3 [Eumeta japonica]
MGSLPRLSVTMGERRPVPTAPLPEHFSRLATSKQTALLYDDEVTNNRVTYAELETRANALARAIAARGSVNGRNTDEDFVVAVCMQPTHGTVTTLLAIWKAGAAYVPMEPTFPQARISHILKDAQPCLVVYDDTAKPKMFADSGVPAVAYEALLLESSGYSTQELEDRELLNPLESESIGIVLYTSGSTGVPKGVRLSHSAICNRLWWQFTTFPFSNDEDICVWKTALTFVDSVCEIWGPLLNGRALRILSKETTRDPQRLVEELAENRIQRLVLVPTLLRSILLYLSLNPSEKLLKRLKLWVCSGETLNKDLAGQFFQYFGDNNGFKLANFYGSTEVMGDVTYYVLESFDQLSLFPTIPIGSPLQNCAVYILDEEMNVVREGETGEIWVGGMNLANGYVGGQAPEKFMDNPHTAHPGTQPTNSLYTNMGVPSSWLKEGKTFQYNVDKHKAIKHETISLGEEFNRLYRTGDFGLLQKGEILYMGRLDSQVKIRGHRVDLQEVESAVSNVPGVEKCVVLCYGADRGTPEILAFVTLQDEARLAGHHIEAALKNSLTHYMIPQNYPDTENDSSNMAGKLMQFG